MLFMIRIIIFICVFFLPVKYVSASVIDDLFSPFDGIDISQTYDQYYSVIDFIVYAIMFVGLSQATLGKRFEGKGGKAVVSAVGMVLAIGLAISERTLGFNLRSFGPLAAGLFIFFVGFMMYLGIKTAGMSAASSGSIALVVTYFSIRAVAPGFFDWMAGNKYMSWMHAVLLIAVLISAYKVIRLIMPGKNKHLGKEALKFAKEQTKGPKDLFDQLHDEKREEEFIKTSLEKVTENAEKTSEQIIEDLVDIKKLIDEYGGTVRGRYLLAQKIETITPEEHQMRRLFVSIQEMVKKFSEFDHNHFEKLKDQYLKLSHDARKEIHTEFKAEWHKIGAEKHLVKHEKELAEYDRNFAHAVSMVIVALKADKIKDAHTWIDEAIKWEKRVLKSFRELEHLEKKIVAYTKREIKAEKKEIKDVTQARRQVKAGKKEAISAKSL
ncbi:hypothetical protein ACFL47_08985 [Candidatus Latescibacterota bacterium]